MEARTDFWEMIEKFDTAMVVTRDGAILRARPMAPRFSREREEILFITSLVSHKVDEISADDEVAVSFTRHGDYVSVSGKARVSTDRMLIDEAWDAAAEAWMPDGKDGPDVAVLVVSPHHAEIWDIDASKVRQAYEFAKAYLGGKESPDIARNEKFRL